MKIGLISLGCPKNLVDAEVMLGLAQQAGHELTPHAADADVLVVNTCAFIDRAKQESIDAILEMAELKKASPSRRLVVTGCLAERYRDELQGPDPGDRRGARHRRGAADRGGARRRRSAGHRRLASSPMVFHRAGCGSNGHQPLGARHRAADLHLRRRHAARPRDAAPLRLREDCRGLRLQVRLLHHPEAARPVPQPSGGLDRHGGAAARRARASGSSSSSARTRPSTASTAASAARSPACCAS